MCFVPLCKWASAVSHSVYKPKMAATDMKSIFKEADVSGEHDVRGELHVIYSIAKIV